MAGVLFPAARDLIVAGSLDWTAGVIRAVLLPEGVSFDYTEEFLDEIPAGSRISISEEIINRTVVDGWYGGKATKFGAVLDTRKVAQAVIFLDTEVEATSRLIAHLPDDGIVGEPFVPAGVDYYLYPDAMYGGFFFLSNIVAPVMASAVQPNYLEPIEIEWVASSSSAPLPLLGYALYRQANSGGYELINFLRPTVTSYEDAYPGDYDDDVQYYVAARYDISDMEPGPGFVEVSATPMTATLVEPPSFILLETYTDDAALLDHVIYKEDNDGAVLAEVYP